jgi:hypothetical protein
MKPPNVHVKDPNFEDQLNEHFRLVWEEISRMKGEGGRAVRFSGPLDLRGIPMMNTAPLIPAKHASSHQSGEYDEIDVTGLSGVLADDQPPKLMAAAQRGGAKLGDVFTIVSEVLTLVLASTRGLEKINGTALGVKQQESIQTILTADAVDPGTTMAMVNEIKAKVNEIIAALKLAEIITPYQGYFHKNYFHANYWSAEPNGYFVART